MSSVKVDAKAELRRVIEGLSDDDAADVLDIVMMHLEPETITDEEYERTLATLAEMNAGEFVRWEDLKRELEL